MLMTKQGECLIDNHYQEIIIVLNDLCSHYPMDYVLGKSVALATD